MGIKNAVVERIKKLCKQKSIKFNELATRSGVTPSTVYSMLDERRLDVGIVLLKKLCDGLEITIQEFFDSDLFDGLEQELK